MGILLSSKTDDVEVSTGNKVKPAINNGRKIKNKNDDTVVKRG